MVAPGLEAVALDEVSGAGFADVRAEPGGVAFRGSPLRANRALALPTRILQRVARFHARTASELRAGAATVDWAPFGGLTAKVTCHHSRLHHTGLVAELLARVVPPGEGALLVRIDRDECTLSVDTSGALLHRRGWREETGPAPLRETLAAGVLALAGWRPGEALHDPMCGAGTFPIEAAGAAAGLAPGRMRRFACELWWPPEPVPATAAVETPVAGGDRSRAAIEAARRNAARAGVEVALACVEAAHATPPAGSGLVVCNPPYGHRVEATAHAFGRLGVALAGPFARWRAAVLCPDPRLASGLGRPVSARHPLRNGGLRLELLLLEAPT